MASVLLGGCLLDVSEEALLRSARIEWLLAPFWLAPVVGLLAWTPVFLLHGGVTIREAMPVPRYTEMTRSRGPLSGGASLSDH